MKYWTIPVENNEFIVFSSKNKSKAMLGKTLARIYEIPLSHLEEIVSKNEHKFPEDFFFPLTLEECKLLREITKGDVALSDFNKKDALWKEGHLATAFTPFGSNMLATLLSSPHITRRSVQIIDGFSSIEKKDSPVLQKDLLEEKWMSELRHLLREELSSSISPENSFFFPPQILSQIKLMEERMRSYEKEIEYLKESILEIKTSDSSHLIIPALTEEVYRNRSELHKVQSQVDQIKGQVHQMELPFFDSKTPKNPKNLKKKRIAPAQAKKIKLLVTKKASSRKNIMALWLAFKKEFSLSRYTHLPATKFEEAIKWLESKNPTNNTL